MVRRRHKFEIENFRGSWFQSLVVEDLRIKWTGMVESDDIYPSVPRGYRMEIPCRKVQPDLSSIMHIEYVPCLDAEIVCTIVRSILGHVDMSQLL